MLDRMTADTTPPQVSSPLLAALSAHRDAGHDGTILQCVPCGASGTSAPPSLGIPLRPAQRLLRLSAPSPWMRTRRTSGDGAQARIGTERRGTVHAGRVLCGSSRYVTVRAWMRTR